MRNMQINANMILNILFCINEMKENNRQHTFSVCMHSNVYDVGFVEDVSALLAIFINREKQLYMM